MNEQAEDRKLDKELGGPCVNAQHNFWRNEIKNLRKQKRGWEAFAGHMRGAIRQKRHTTACSVLAALIQREGLPGGVDELEDLCDRAVETADTLMDSLIEIGRQGTSDEKMLGIYPISEEDEKEEVRAEGQS